MFAERQTLHFAPAMLHAGFILLFTVCQRQTTPPHPFRKKRGILPLRLSRHSSQSDGGLSRHSLLQQQCNYWKNIISPQWEYSVYFCDLKKVCRDNMLSRTERLVAAIQYRESIFCNPALNSALSSAGSSSSTLPSCDRIKGNSTSLATAGISTVPSS